MPRDETLIDLTTSGYRPMKQERMFPAEQKKPPRQLPGIGTVMLYTVLPGVFLLTVLSVRASHGPIYFAYDPDYAYLMNALALAVGEPSHLTLHPGTPIQMLGAVVVWVVNAFRGFPPVVTDVIKNPEIYAQAIHAVVIVLIFAGLVALGLAARRVTASTMVGLLVQLGPFFTPHLLRVTGRLSTDLMIPLSGIVLMLALFHAMRHDVRPGRAALWCGLAMGLGIASKFLFTPLGLIPLLMLPTWRSRLWLMAATLAGFAFFALPMIESFGSTFNWLYRAFLGSGIHAGGEATVVDVDSLSANFSRAFFRMNPMLPAILAATAGMTVVVAVAWLRGLRTKPYPVLSGLAALAFTQIYTVALMTKAPLPMYQLSGASVFALLPVLVWLFAAKLQETRRWWAMGLKASIVMLCLAMTLRGGIGANSLTSNLEVQRDEYARTYHRIDTVYRSCAIAHMFRSTHVARSFMLGNDWTALYFKDELAALLPRHYNFYSGKGQLRYWGSPIVFADVAGDYPCFVLLGTPFPKGELPDWPGIGLEEIERGKYLALYRMFVVAP